MCVRGVVVNLKGTEMGIRKIQKVVLSSSFLIGVQADANQTADKGRDAKRFSESSQFMALPNPSNAPQPTGGGGIYEFCTQPGMNNRQMYYNALNNILGQPNGWEPVQFTQSSNSGVLCTVILFRRVPVK